MQRNVTQAIVVPQTTAAKNIGKEKIALFNEDGTPASTFKKMAAQADTTAVDLAALKVDFNALLAKLRTAGLMATS